jgi:quercetin dioxygenase-like cupin family protein
MEFHPLEQLGCEITHHFSSGVYAKEVIIPAGRLLVQHKHAHDHMSILASGRVVVSIGDRKREYSAPAVINIPAGVSHSVASIADSVWFCVHHTNETDPDEIDAQLILET